MNFYYRRNEDKTPQQLAGRWETLDIAEKWYADALTVAPAPGGVAFLQIDMGQALERLKESGSASRAVPHLELVLKALALACARHRRLYKLAIGYRRYYPPDIDVALSVVGDTFLGPLAVIRGADHKSLAELSQDVTAQSVVARRDDERLRAAHLRSRWIPTFAFLRRMMLRVLTHRRSFRQKGPGVLQLTYVPDVDMVAGLKFMATGLFAVGALRERVIAVKGQPVVRPTLWLSCSADHSVWDGMCLSVLMKEIKAILEDEPSAL